MSTICLVICLGAVRLLRRDRLATSSETFADSNKFRKAIGSCSEFHGAQRLRKSEFGDCCLNAEKVADCLYSSNVSLLSWSMAVA